MNKIVSYVKNPSNVIFGLALLAIFGIALFIRIYFPHDIVFKGDWIRFNENDPWYHMRIIENLSHHFPHIMGYDPYNHHPFSYSPPGGLPSTFFFDWLIGFFIWVIGLGSPSKHTIETVGACFPAVMGALITIPVFFITKTTFNKTAGIIAAAITAIIPGQFLWRSIAGFTDNHIAEVFYSTFTMMFLVLALKSAIQNNITFTSIKNRDWKSLRKPLIFSILTGITIALYCLSWSGAGLFALIIFVFMIIQFISDHLRGRSTDYLCMVCSLLFLTAVIIIWPLSELYSIGIVHFHVLTITLITALGAGILSSLIARSNKEQTFYKRFFYPLALIALGGIAYLILHFGFTEIRSSIFSYLKVFRPDRGLMTTSEVIPLDWEGAWNMLNIPWLLAIVSTIIITISAIIKGEANKILLVVWAIFIFVLTMDLPFTDGRQRSVYYLCINIAIMAGYFSWLILYAAQKLTRSVTGQVDETQQQKSAYTAKESLKSKKVKHKKAVAQRKTWTINPHYSSVKYIFSAIALLIVFFTALYPYIIPYYSYQTNTILWAEQSIGADDNWHEALTWLKDNSPEPFGDPDYFYELYPTNKPYESPESAYGIMSWWDYGYWITYIAHRAPFVNPGSRADADTAGKFFAAQDEQSAMEIMESTDCKYVIIDRLMMESKFYAMAIYAGQSAGDFSGTYCFKDQNGKFSCSTFFYPEHYRSMCSRLYLFGGNAWDPYEDWTKLDPENYIFAIAYENKVDPPTGINYNYITQWEQFKTYEEAQAWVTNNPRFRIVGINPLISPVPLEELDNFKLVHKSPSTVRTRGEETISQVEVFEYSADGWNE